MQKPFRGTVVSEFECQTLEVDGEGPFGAATQRIVKAWVDLTA